MAEYVAIIGIIVSVLLALVMLLLTIIGYFANSRMRSIDTSLKCLPEIQVELAGMKVKVQQHSEKQDDFCDKQDEFGERLLDVEKHISNTERIAVLETSLRTVKDEVDKLRPIVHQIPTLQQTLGQVVHSIDSLQSKLASP